MAIKAPTAADLHTAAQEYEAAYREYEALTRMNVPTPCEAGTFGGVWECDQGQLLRALALAIRRTQGTCSVAAEKAARGQVFVIAAGNYGEAPEAGEADVYRMPNGMLRDPDGRYLGEAETALIRRTENWGHDAHYWTAGRITQRWIDEQAAGQIGRTLTRPYLVGWPERCNDWQRLDAYHRVRDIYRTLLAAFRDAAE